MPCAQKALGENLFKKLMLAIRELPRKKWYGGICRSIFKYGKNLKGWINDLTCKKSGH
jgi:hypothetical protein